MDGFLKESGIKLIFDDTNNIITVPKQQIAKFRPVPFIASEYPLPATEWQVLFSPLIGLIKGKSTIIDKYYPMRMQHWEGLNILGAKGNVIKDKEGNYTSKVKVEGVKSYHSGEINVNAVRDACLLIAGLSVKGRVIINDPKDHIKRGYQDLAENIIKLGGKIDIKDKERSEKQ